MCLLGIAWTGPADAQQPQPAGGVASSAVATVATPTWEFHPKPGMNQPYVPSWRVLGPFAWTEPAFEPSSTDHSDAIARQLDHAFLPMLKIEGGTEESLPSGVSGLPTKRVDTTNGLVRLHTVLSNVKFQVAYAECEIVSDSTQVAVLLPESDDGIKIWLNGEMVLNVPAIRTISQFGGHIRIHLRKGANHLIVKLARTQQRSIWDPWDFAVGVRSLEGALDEIAGRGEPHFLPNVILPVGKQLDVDLTLFPPRDKASLELTQAGVKKRFDLTTGVTSSISLNAFSSGPIETSLQFGRYKFEEPILYGAADEIVARYHAELPKYFNEPRHQANLGALLIRFDHLLDPAYRENDNQLWQKKIAQLCWQAEQITTDIRAGRDPYTGKTGTWLRGFNSTLDGQLQYYIVHAPAQKQAGTPHLLPLVIELPYEEIPLRPYLHSTPVAQYSDIKLHDRAADANGFAYLWLNNRGNSYGQDFGMTELFSALAEVERDYPIDKDRIYLFGGCSGALYALSLAVDHPDLFAAVGAVTPVSRYRRVTLDDPPSPTDRFGCNWLQARSPVEWMENLLNVPVLAIHGDEDHHNSISESKALDAAAHAVGAPFELSVEHGGTELRWPEEPLYSTFDFFKGKSRSIAPAHFVYTSRSPKYGQTYWLKIENRIDPLSPARIEGKVVSDGLLSVQTLNVGTYSILLDKLPQLVSKPLKVQTNGHDSYVGVPEGSTVKIEVASAAPDLKSAGLPGPMSEAFSSPFLMVVGTEGPGAAAAAAQAQTFQQSWEQRFFTTPRKKLDIELTDADIHSYNLVLFGTVQSNSLLKRIADRLPVRYTATGVSVGGQAWDGDGYSIQAVFPNPLDITHYVVLAGDPACAKCPANALQFTLHAWYDVAIWHQDQAGTVRLVSVGNFDRNWEKVVPARPCPGMTP
jgi:predicted esterase